MNGEVLKGKTVDLSRTVSVQQDLGGGWGLGSGSVAGKGKKDRYAEAHEREFAR
jgi:hypothetical protein